MAHAVKVHSPPIPNFGILFMERHKNKSTNDSMLRVCLCSDILRQQEISPSNDAFKIILGNRIGRKVWSLKHSIHEMFEF